MDYKEITFKDLKISEEQEPYIYSIEGLFEQKVFSNEIELVPKCTKRSFLIMDNEKYNETYLKDVFEEWYKELDDETKAKAAEVNYYYTGDFRLRMLLTKPHIFDIRKEYTEQEKTLMEHQVLSPVILSFNPNSNVIGIIEEPRMGVITKFDIPDIFKFLHDDSITLDD